LPWVRTQPSSARKNPDSSANPSIGWPSTRIIRSPMKDAATRSIDIRQVRGVPPDRVRKRLADAASVATEPCASAATGRAAAK
jgi:hypothetical protein